MARTLDEIIKEKINFLESVPDVFIGTTVGNAESRLLALITKEVIDNLDVQDGKIVNSLKNMRLVAAMDAIWKDFQATDGLGIIKQHTANLSKVVSLNDDYYGKMLGRMKGRYKLAKAKVGDIINRRLGLNKDGSLIRAGYMNGLLEDVTVREQVKEFVIRSVAQADGFNDMRAKFREFITGNDEKLGVLRKWYGNITYDVYKQADGLNNLLFSKEFDLDFFVYDGTIIKTTRLFCRKRVGLVFSKEEAEDWKNDPDLTAAPLNYNPFTDMGGYRCRHIPRFITDEMAYDLDPARKPK